MRNTKFHGIVAFGRSHTAAVTAYRLLAMGKGAAVLSSESGDIALIASETADVFNPMTGDMDLVARPELLKKAEFSSESSVATKNLHHMVCTSGCGMHVVVDSKEILNYCPACTTSLSGDDEMDDESVDEEDTSEAEDEGDEEDFDLSSITTSGDDEEEDDESSDEEDSETEEDGDEDMSESSDQLVVVAASLDLAVAEYHKVKAADGLVSQSGESHVDYVVCSSAACGAHIVADIGSTPRNCPMCFSATEQPEESDDAEVELTDETGGEDTGEDDAEADTAKEEDTDTTEDSGEVVDDGEVAEAESSTSGKCESEDDTEEETDGEGDSTDNDLSLTDDAGNVLTGEEEVDVSDEIPEEANAADLDVSYSTSIGGNAAWTAYYKGVPVAMASKSSVGKNADIFDDARFGHVVLASAKLGVKGALQELGFQSIKHKVSLSRKVAQMVQAQVVEREQALAAEHAQMKSGFLSALATAAIGINRGFFKDLENPIKANLWNALSGVGIQAPEVLIDRAFAAHSDAYHDVLFRKAVEIASQPEVVQQSLSAAVSSTGYQAVSSSFASVEDRIEGLGTSVSSAKSVAQVSTSAQVETQVDDFKEVSKRAVSSLGRPSR